MSAAARRVRLRALAKINLDLRVLHKRPDGFHEIRTVFQTISLADSIEIAFSPARKTSIELEQDVEIPGNLMLRAAAVVLEAMGKTGRVVMKLRKQIPIGGGLGGGSTDAAAVLRALPVLAGRVVPIPLLVRLASALGSDVPFFLFGGKAVGIGRGAELFPLPDGKARSAVVVAPGVQVSTAAAYRNLGTQLTAESARHAQDGFSAAVWGRESAMRNDFERVVFQQHPQLAALKQRLIKAGATTALMSGSGSSVFGLFRTKEDARRASKAFGNAASAVSLVSRRQYDRIWKRQLVPTYINQSI